MPGANGIRPRYITHESSLVVAIMHREVGPGIMLTPTKDLTQNEIAKAVRMDEFNVQNQQMIEWPRNLITAKVRGSVRAIAGSARS